MPLALHLERSFLNSKLCETAALQPRMNSVISIIHDDTDLEIVMTLGLFIKWQQVQHLTKTEISRTVFKGKRHIRSAKPFILDRRKQLHGVDLF